MAAHIPAQWNGIEPGQYVLTMSLTTQTLPRPAEKATKAACLPLSPGTTFRVALPPVVCLHETIFLLNAW